MVWKVRWRGKDLYIVLLLELQSTCELDMALRMLVYVVLFYQGLLKQKPLRRGEKLPLVLPMVFYNGEVDWWASLEVSDLIEPGPASFAGYRPSMRYYLIDEKRWPLKDLEGLVGNVAAGIARAEQDHGPEYLMRTAGELGAWLDRPEHGALRRDLLAWLSKVVFPARVPGVDVPELRDLYEFQTYLEANMQTWPEQWEAKGWQRGRQDGRREGQLEGEAAVLLRQIELKLGPVAESVRARIQAATDSELLRWTERVLTAETLPEVFGAAERSTASMRQAR